MSIGYQGAKYDRGIDHEPASRDFGFRPSDQKRVRALRPYRDANDLIPETAYAAFDLRMEDTGPIAVKDQAQYGSCNGHSTASGVECERWVEGLEYVPMSAWWVYGNLTGGADSGSNPLDALQLITETGCAPESDVPWGMFDPRKFTAQAKQDAGRYRVELGGVLSTAAEIVSAVMRLEPLNLTVTVGAGFQRGDLDAEGVPPLGWGANNHAVLVWGGLRLSTKWGPLVKMQNSWTTAWGLKGFCWLPVTRLIRYRGFECYNVKSVGSDPRSKNPPKMATWLRGAA